VKGPQLALLPEEAPLVQALEALVVRHVCKFPLCRIGVIVCLAVVLPR